MRVKLFTLRFSPTLGAFDESPLQDFSRDKEVLSFREHFFLVNDVPHLACVVTFQEPVVPPAVIEAGRAAMASATSTGSQRPADRSDRPDRPDPAAGLGESDRLLFNTLRSWRSQRAKKEGVPPYVILTNKELIEVVVRKPEDRTALGHLDGIGPSKVERYGREIIEKLHGHRPVAAAAPAPPPAPPPAPAPAPANAKASVTIELEPGITMEVSP